MATLATRNQNPGNIKDPSTGNFRQFSSKEEGFAALLNDIEGKVTGNTRTGLGPQSTLHDFVNTWAPASDNNNPGEYTAFLANELGVRPDSTLQELQSRVPDLAKSVAKFEGYQFEDTAPQQQPVQGLQLPPEPGQGVSNPQQPMQGIGNVLPPEPPKSFLPTEIPNPEEQQNKGLLGTLASGVNNLAKDIVRPVASTVAAPFQLASYVARGMPAGEQKNLNVPWLGEIQNPANAGLQPENQGKSIAQVAGGEALRAGGNALQTVALGAGTSLKALTAGGAAFGAGSDLANRQKLDMGVLGSGAVGAGLGLGAGLLGKVIGAATKGRTQIAKNLMEPEVKTVIGSGSSKSEKEAIDLLRKYTQQAKQKVGGNFKVETPLESEGALLGKAYDKVIAQHKQIGAKIGEEMKKVGGQKVDLAPQFRNLETSLLERGGLVINKGKLVGTAGELPFSKQEMKFLNEYVKDFNKLGANPTRQNIRNFLKRVPAELDIKKSKAGVSGTTNAEGIIKQSLSELRQASVQGAKTLEKLNKEFTDVSNFLEQGVGILGKKTLSGDYTKDASILKSSIQSVLNSGKRDFLIDLERRSGFPALDRAQIALKAMKDAGDFRGLSLNETLMDMSNKLDIPTSKADMMGRVANFAKEKFIGSKTEQTERVLQDLQNKKPGLLQKLLQKKGVQKTGEEAKKAVPYGVSAQTTQQ